MDVMQEGGGGKEFFHGNNFLPVSVRQEIRAVCFEDTIRDVFKACSDYVVGGGGGEREVGGRGRGRGPCIKL